MNRKLTRKCQRCEKPVVDIIGGVEDQMYPGQRCLRVLDAPLGQRQSLVFAGDWQSEGDRFRRTMSAGWFDRSQRITKIGAFFDKMALDSVMEEVDVDGKACAECVKIMFSEYDERLNDTMFMVSNYDRRLAEERNNNAVEVGSDEELAALMAEDAALDEELRKLDEESDGVAAEDVLLMEEMVSLEKALEEEQARQCALRWSRQRAMDELSRWRARRDDWINQLDRLKQTRVHEDLFVIGRDTDTSPTPSSPAPTSSSTSSSSSSALPVVNGLRLASVPSCPVAWEELNAAFGECALLLHTCASKLRYAFKSWRPVALLDASRMERPIKGSPLIPASQCLMPAKTSVLTSQSPSSSSSSSSMLSQSLKPEESLGSGVASVALQGSFRTAVLSNQLNDALGALLEATDELVQTVARRLKVSAPYRVTGRMIGDSKDNWYSVERPMRDTTKWARAMLYLLGHLKWLLSVCASADTARLGE